MSNLNKEAKFEKTKKNLKLIIHLKCSFSIHTQANTGSSDPMIQ